VGGDGGKRLRGRFSNGAIFAFSRFSILSTYQKEKLIVDQFLFS